MGPLLLSRKVVDIRVLVCGGGNAAHVLVPTIKHACGAWVGLFTLLEDEARLLEPSCAQGITAVYESEQICAPPDAVHYRPERIVPEADVIILAVPAFAHDTVVRAIAPYVQEGAWLGAMPSRSGFEFYRCERHLRHRHILLFGYQTLPWACRIEEYGRRVRVMGEKACVGVSTSPPDASGDVAALLARLTGVPTRNVGCMAAISLGNVGQVIHPTIMYGLFKEKEDIRYTERDVPLFYQSMDDNTARELEMVSEEVVSGAHALAEMSDGILDLSEVVGLRQWITQSYYDQIEDKSSLRSCFVTNRAYNMLKAPVVRQPDGTFVPDFRSRYLTEDVPFGLLVSRGICHICGVMTPKIDEVIETTSRWMGYEFLVDGLPTGRHLGNSRHPLVFDIKSVAELIATNLWECRVLEPRER